MLTLKQINILLQNGFIDREIKAFNNAKTPTGESQKFDLDSPVWKEALKDRGTWSASLKLNGITKKEYVAVVSKFLDSLGKNKETNEFIFLREQYGKSVHKETNYKEARKNRSESLAREKVSELYKKRRW